MLFAQALGRGLRLSPATGKEHCLLLDATGATERHNLFSVAELLWDLRRHAVRGAEHP